MLVVGGIEVVTGILEKTDTARTWAGARACYDLLNLSRYLKLYMLAELYIFLQQSIFTFTIEPVVCCVIWDDEMWT